MTAIMDTSTERQESAGAFAAGVYPWADAQGVVRSGDRSPSGVAAKAVALPPVPPARSATSVAAKQRVAQRKAQSKSSRERQADVSVRSLTEEARQACAQDTERRITEAFANER